MLDEEFIPEEGDGSEAKNKRPQNAHLAIFAYIPFLCFIALFSRESNDYTRAHGRQGLILLIIEIVALLMLLPIGAFFWKLVLIACLVASVAGVVFAVSGRPFNLPFLGDWADRF